MEMYTESALLKHAEENFRDIFATAGKKEQGIILGIITEHRVAKNRNAEITDKAGSDLKEKGAAYKLLRDVLLEVKRCGVLKNGQYLRWSNINSKKSLCDYMILIDGVNDIEYQVPHDVAFNKMKIKSNEICTTKANMKILSEYVVERV